MDGVMAAATLIAGVFHAMGEVRDWNASRTIGSMHQVKSNINDLWAEILP
jgi:hypothetical protein